mgnify:CR=1 FL=1
MPKIQNENYSLHSAIKIENERIDLLNIGLIIKKLRIQRGITRHTLAIKSSISIRYLAQLESGKGNPTITILKNIAYALNLTLKDLLFYKKNNTKVDLIKSKVDNYNNNQLKEVLNFLNNFDKKAPKKINKNKLALLGLRGAGKTTLGKMYSKEFKIPLYEISSEIEKAGGMKISEIIELGGQGMYRRLEFQVINNLLKKNKKLIVLTGGSIVSEIETYNFVLENFYTIWIKAKPEEHMNRVIKQGDLRPMGSNPKAMDDLNSILKERKNLYLQADAIVNTENKNKNDSYKELKEIIIN